MFCSLKNIKSKPKAHRFLNENPHSISMWDIVFFFFSLLPTLVQMVQLCIYHPATGLRNTASQQVTFSHVWCFLSGIYYRNKLVENPWSGFATCATDMSVIIDTPQTCYHPLHLRPHPNDRNIINKWM